MSISTRYWVPIPNSTTVLVLSMALGWPHTCTDWGSLKVLSYSIMQSCCFLSFFVGFVENNKTIKHCQPYPWTLTASVKFQIYTQKCCPANRNRSKLSCGFSSCGGVSREAHDAPNTQRSPETRPCVEIQAPSIFLISIRVELQYFVGEQFSLQLGTILDLHLVAH